MRYLQFLIFLLSFPAFGQDQQPQAELTSYTWYLGGQWDSLFIHRKELIRNSGQDYFFMRYRLGEAAFRLKKYRIAIEEFEHAITLNSADTFSLKYLEVALREAGRTQEAVLAGQKLIQLGATKLPRYKIRSMNYLMAEVGRKVSDSKDIGNLNYTSFSCGLLPTPRLLVHASYSNVRQTKYYGEVLQHMFSGNARWQSKHGVSFRGHFSYLDVSVNYNDNSNRYLQHQVGGLGVRKSAGNWDWDVSADIGNLNYEDQIQQTAGITWFPFSDSRLLLNYQLISQQQEGSVFWVHKPSLQIGLSRTLWLGMEYYQGNTRNIIENNGFLINNAYDILHYRYIGSLNWYPSRHFAGYLSAIHESRTEAIEGFDYVLNGVFLGFRISPW
jgi:hypothetical protein